MFRHVGIPLEQGLVVEENNHIAELGRNKGLLEVFDGLAVGVDRGIVLHMHQNEDLVLAARVQREFLDDRSHVMHHIWRPLHLVPDADDHGRSGLGAW